MRRFSAIAGSAAFFVAAPCVVAGLVPWLAFTLSYAACAQRLAWPWCIAIAFTAWTVAAVACVLLQDGPTWLIALPALLMAAAILLYPRGTASGEKREHGKWPCCSRAGLSPFTAW